MICSKTVCSKMIHYSTCLIKTTKPRVLCSRPQRLSAQLVANYSNFAMPIPKTIMSGPLKTMAIYVVDRVLTNAVARNTCQRCNKRLRTIKQGRRSERRSYLARKLERMVQLARKLERMVHKKTRNQKKNVLANVVRLPIAWSRRDFVR